MFNVGDMVYTVDTITDEEKKPIKRYIGIHKVAGISVDQNGIIYKFIINDQIFESKASQVVGSFDEIVYLVENTNPDKKVCRRCGEIFEVGKGFEERGFNLCSKCIEVIKEKVLMGSVGSENTTCECGCEDGECNCKKSK